MKLAPIARDAAANAVTALASGGVLIITSQGQPVAHCALSEPAFLPSAGGTARARPIAPEESSRNEAPVLADGYQVLAAGGEPLWEGPAGEASELVLRPAVLEPGGRIEITAFSYTQPE